MTITARGVQAQDASFEPMQITRRALTPEDVEIAIAYCGVCHTDLHQVRDWPTTRFPCVPGHEIVGQVVAVGSGVTRFSVGDTVGVGVMVDSCQHCEHCRDGLENMCRNGSTQTYNSPCEDAPGYTLGGYSERIVVKQDFVLRVSHSVDQLAAVAPLLCAGITTYSALRNWKVAPGQRVGIVGIGGLGHVAVKIAAAMGAHVTAFTTSESKRQDALDLGAHEVVNSRNPEEMAGREETLDFILNTVAVSHVLDDYIVMLKRDSAMAMVGVPNTPHPSPDVRNLYRRRRSLTGSLTGGLAETQEMLDFCAEHGITAEIEMISADEIDTAFERLLHNDVKYRFVIDGATMAG